MNLWVPLEMRVFHEKTDVFGKTWEKKKSKQKIWQKM